ncbi:MAG: glycosyltransferase family 2 protein [Chloroflexia bacterium]|nr:glycosyltransferase family 2 protein [Chloroflexia bacterium]
MNRRGVSAVVVSYNVRELLLNCLRSLEQACASGVLNEIVVVDNNSSDGSPHAVREHFPEVCVIDAPNRGYGAGANLGVSLTSGDYVLILNPDTVVSANSVCRLAQHLDANPDVAVCAPRLRYPTGDLQSSRRRFPARLTPIFESTIFQQWWPANPLKRRYHMEDSPEDEIQDVDWVVGACLMVRRKAIDCVGGFDESFWMYCEETEWCWRFRRHGWRISYLPDVEIVHHEGASTGQNIPLRQLAFDRSRIELQRRLYGRSTALAVEAVIRFGYFVQMIVEAAKWARGHRRNLRRQRVEFYRQLLLSRLRFDENQNR